MTNTISHKLVIFPKLTPNFFQSHKKRKGGLSVSSDYFSTEESFLPSYSHTEAVEIILSVVFRLSATVRQTYTESKSQNTTDNISL